MCFHRVLLFYCSVSFCRSRINLLTLFAPSVDPCSLPTRKGITRHSQDLTNGRSTEGMQPLTVHIISHIECCPLLYYIKGGTITLQFTLTGTESFDFFAILIVDIVPALRCLNMANALRPKSECRT